MQLLRQWIESLPGPPVLPPPEISPRGGKFEHPVTVTLQERTGGGNSIHAGWNGPDTLGFAL